MSRRAEPPRQAWGYGLCLGLGLLTAVWSGARLSRARRVLLGAAVPLLLAGCADEKQDVFSPEGSQAERIDDLQVPVFAAAGVVGLLVLGGVVFILVRYGRRRTGDDSALPVQIHGNLRLEIAWLVVPALILAVVAVSTLRTVFALAATPDDALRVRVHGQQWWWSYEYDLDADGKPEVVTANDLVIPAGEDVVLEVTARDVIHSFWVPALAGTMDAVPGRVSQLAINAERPGIFFGQCKEFCGLSHANMRARVVALDPSQFATWLDQQRAPAQSPLDPDARAGQELFESLPCSRCHQIRGVNDPLEVDEDLLVAGSAPDLTHFMSRGVFASSMFPLYDDRGELNRADLEEWLRNPQDMLPMDADDQPYRGMPDLGLTEGQIDQLVAYLATLGPAPPYLDDPAFAEAG